MLKIEGYDTRVEDHNLRCAGGGKNRKFKKRGKIVEITEKRSKKKIVLGRKKEGKGQEAFNLKHEH